jgi:acyl carrier protein
MDPSAPVDLDGVKAVLVETLGLQDRDESISAETRLFGALPELDSLAVVELIVALEDRFGIEVAPEDVTAETFETLGSLSAFVGDQLRSQA